MTRLDLGAVWRDTLAVVQRHFGVFVTVEAAFAFVPRLVLGVAFPTTGRLPSLVHPSPQPAGFFWALLLVALIALVGTFVVADIAADPAEGGGRPLGETIVGVLPKIGKGLVAGLLLFLAYLVFSVVLGIVGAIVAIVVMLTRGGASSTPPSPATIGVFVLAIIVVVMPLVLWLGGRLTPLLGVLLREPISASAAIRRAWTLSRGSGWRIAAVWLAMGVVTFAVQAVLWAIDGPAQPGEGMTAVHLVTIIVQGAFGAWLSVYFYAGSGIVYRHLAERPG